MPDPISVRLPSALAEALDARVAQEARDPNTPGSNRSAVVQAALRSYLGFQSTGSNPGPSQEEFDQLRGEVEAIKRAAEASGVSL